MVLNGFWVTPNARERVARFAERRFLIKDGLLL